LHSDASPALSASFATDFFGCLDELFVFLVCSDPLTGPSSEWVDPCCTLLESAANQGRYMMALSVGQLVWVQCKVQPGPFSEEPLVTIQSVEGPVTGFVKSDELKSFNDQTTVRGIVRGIGRDHVEVWIKGSFFTTNGLTNVPTELAMAA
jgi:hypothetical protein